VVYSTHGLGSPRHHLTVAAGCCKYNYQQTQKYISVCVWLTVAYANAVFGRLQKMSDIERIVAFQK